MYSSIAELKHRSYFIIGSGRKSFEDNSREECPKTASIPAKIWIWIRSIERGYGFRRLSINRTPK